MSIGGGIKFFNKSQNLYADGAVLVSSTGDSSSARAIDRNPITYWRSVASTDLITETLTLTFASSQTFNRLLLVDHNWKQFTAKYFSAGSYVNFSSVVGLDSTGGSLISETVFADDTAYYEFASVTTTSIQFTVLKTQVANAQKYINQIICTTELGTLVGYPKITGFEHDRNTRAKEMLSGKKLYLKSEEAMKLTLDFSPYPASLSADIELMYTLYDRETNFIIWICGGRRGTTYFKKQQKGFRLKDVYTVQTAGHLVVSYVGNTYQNMVNFNVALEEAVD